MTDCTYCEAQFETEEGYVEHLHEAHAKAELGRIDRRRVEQVYDTDSDTVRDWAAPIVIVGIVVLTAGVLQVLMSVPGVGAGHGGGTGRGDGGGMGGGHGGSGPSCLGAVHYHGTIRMTVDGNAVDFGTDRYQGQDRAFHFEGGDGTRWHVHAEGVTLRYALLTLGIEVTESSVVFDGETYRDSDPNTSVVVAVNGAPVSPSEYVLQRGDRVRVVVNTTANGS